MGFVLGLVFGPGNRAIDGRKMTEDGRQDLAVGLNIA